MSTKGSRYIARASIDEKINELSDYCYLIFEYLLMAELRSSHDARSEGKEDFGRGLADS